MACSHFICTFVHKPLYATSDLNETVASIIVVFMKIYYN